MCIRDRIEIESIGVSKSEAKKAPAAKASETEEKPERVKGMPSGYEDLTVAEIKDASFEWNRPMLEAALEYERAHAKRKGALVAIESALTEKEEGS